MALPTFAEVSKAIGHSYCRGIQPNGQICHENHEGRIINGTVHWGDRRATRSGVRRFLHLQAMAIVNRIHDTEPFWKRYYRAQKLVQIWSDHLAIRFPADVTDWYRLELRAMLERSRNEPRDELKDEATRWSTIKT